MNIFAGTPSPLGCALIRMQLFLHGVQNRARQFSWETDEVLAMNLKLLVGSLGQQ